MKDKPIITVLGGGNGAFATSADLSLKGFEVRMLECQNYSQVITPVLEKMGIDLENEVVEEFQSGFADSILVTTNPKLAMESTDIVLFVVPGFAEKIFVELIKPYIRPNQIIVFFCGVFGGALEFMNHLQTQGFDFLPLIAETEALIYGALKSSSTSVMITGRKKGLALAGLPACYTDEIIEHMRPLIPDITKANNVVETGLRNANIILHPPISILNAGRLDGNANSFRFYWDGVTQPVGNVVQALDDERIKICKALELSLPSTKERLIEWYGNQGAHGETLGEIMATNPPYKAAYAPRTLNHRFITEDIPFGLVPLEGLGRNLNISTPITTSLITLSCELLERDFREEGRNIKKLGMEGLSKDALKKKLTF